MLPIPCNPFLFLFLYSLLICLWGTCMVINHVGALQTIYVVSAYYMGLIIF